MTIGNKIKLLRKSKGYSQIELAKMLNISSQAISKWESDVSSPDISLLPNIASLFGVAIDDLFEYSKEQEYEKIEHMIEYQRFLTNDEFMHAEQFLLKEIEDMIDNHRALSTLGDLYHFQATRLDIKAAHYAKMALRLKPNNKFDINTIHNACKGGGIDWNVKNHYELNDQYRQILKEEPANTRIRYYLLANLVDDGCITEAKKVLAEAKQIEDNSLNKIYELLIDIKEFGYLQMKDKIEKLGKEYSSDWMITFEIADIIAHQEDYQTAIDYYQLSFEHEPIPRYVDALEAIAQLYLLLDDKQSAILTYQKHIKVLKEEWNIKSGDMVDQLNQKIMKLKV